MGKIMLSDGIHDGGGGVGIGAPGEGVSSADRLLRQLDRRRIVSPEVLVVSRLRDVRRLSGYTRDLLHGLNVSNLLTVSSQGPSSNDDELLEGTLRDDETERADSAPIDLSGVDLEEVSDTLLLTFFFEMDLNITATQNQEERLVMEEVKKRLTKFFAQQLGICESNIFDLNFRGATSRSLYVNFRLNAKSIGATSAVMRLGGLMQKLGTGSWLSEGNDIFAVNGIVLNESVVTALT